MQQIDAATYTQGPVGPHLVKMTGFMVFGMVAIMAANLIETVYISFLGTQELAALGFSFPIIMLIQSTAMGLSVCLLYTSPSPRDLARSRMPSAA